MGRPENGACIVQGEVNLVVIAMRRNSRWSSRTHQDEEQDPLLNSFSQLKDVLNSISSLQELAPNEFLSPFLEVIRSEDTTGPITGLALTSVNKFLSYGLIDPNSSTAAAAIENIADAVTHARFVGTDPSNDEVVLMKILHVLRTLLLTAAGAMLTNESVCEIMQSCFRICFEMRLSELLRKSAEHTLMDMVQLLFSRLPHFKEDPKWATSLKKLKMRTGGIEQARGGRLRKRSPKPKGRKGKSHSQAAAVLTHSQNYSEPVEHPKKTVEFAPQIETKDGCERSSDTQPASEDPRQQDLPLEYDQVARDIITQEKGQVESRPDYGYVVSGTDKPSPRVPTDLLPTPPESNLTSPVEEPVTTSVTIATTPTAGNRTLVDIQQGFKDSDSDGRDQTDVERTSISLDIADSYIGRQSPDRSHTLQVPSSDDMQRADSEQDLRVEVSRVSMDGGEDGESTHSATDMSESTAPHDTEYVNPRGVRFMQHHQHGRDGSGPLIPYGLPCVRELFRFLVSLTNPLDRHNTDVMVHMGLSLLTVALEAGADHIASFSSLLCLVRDDMCKNLFFLMQSERLSLFAASLRVCFLLFESMRSHLKFQLEMYLTRLMEIIVSESTRISYEQCEVALESVVQILRIPGLVTELYLNYDCDLYCTNLFEDLMKLLSKNAFPVKGLFTTNLLSLDALLAVIDSIEQHCHHRVLHTNKKHADSPTMNRRKSPEGMVEGAPDEEFTVPPTPPPSGYVVADKMQASQDSTTGGTKNKSAEVRSGPRIRPNRMKVCGNMPCEEELAAIKHKKKLYHTGSEQFNMKPTKGIAFLQEHGLLTDPLDAGEIVVFLKENPKLDKKQIGEFISARKNMTVLEAFQKSFNFEDARIDEALRMYLESFRLPGEAPVISYLLEHFADHWHKMNNEPFANTDAAFTLAYAVLMLNTDQHNTNAKKQNIPMTSEDFKRNLRKVNGGQDFDEDMLEEIFCAIKSDEIVMPSEQVGIVKENYLWKMLIRRGNSKDGDFLHAPTGAFDRDLFALVWGPTVAALSFVFDKSVDETIIQKAISGFRKCAMISAHYGISDVFDNLIISLCKFTTLLSTAEEPRHKGRSGGSAEAIPVSFGNNQKAQLSARTMFALAHRHGDILREGWKNILDCMLQLFRAKLLPETLVKVDDFIDPSGKISLIQEKNAAIQRAEPGVLSSLYSLFSLTETPQQRGPTPEEQEASRRAAKCIDECHVEQLIQESKFLRVDSLHDLIKALIFQSQSLEAQESLNGQTRCDDESPVFFLELLIKVILQNRDRIGPFWQIIRAHFYSLIVHVPKKTTLVERAVVGLLTLAKRLLCREDLAPQVLESLRILLMMEKNVIHDISRQVAYGLHDLLKGNAANIHSKADWYTLFTLLEVTGAGTSPVPFQPAEGSLPPPAQDAASESGAQSDSEVMSTSTQGRPEDTGRGYTSDSELYESASRHGSKTHAAEPSETRPDITVKPLPDKDGSWVLQNDHVEAKTDNSTLQVYNKDKQATTPPDDRDALTTSSRILKRNQFSIDLNEELTRHDPKALTKSCETLAFLVRDAAHVTPHNFESCVHAIRTFVEAGLNGGRPIKPKQVPERKEKHHRKKTESQMNRSRSSPSHLSNLPDSDEEGKEADGYHSLSIQLLDLMHTLHTRAATIFSSWAEEDKIRQEETYSDEATGIDAATSTLWTKCWCPLLQGIACLCCDSRRQVRSQALTYLQKALLVHDLQTLSAFEWESCFNKVLFPLLSKLLENINTQDPSGIEETRMRASALLCKVFLQHLTPLLQLSTFTALWLTILEFMDKYMHADRSDLLCEAIPESLKNMLLVMHTAGILQNGGTEESQLWKLTWDRIDTFLPKLREEVFKPHELEHRRSIPRQEPAVQAHTSTGPSENPAPVTTQSEPPETVAHQYTQPPETVAHQYSQQQQYAQQQYAQQAYQYDQQQHAATAQAQQQPSSAVPVHGTGASEASESSAGESRTSESYLTSTGAPSQAQYVLHPPLPSGLGVPGAGGGTVPLLLDPNIIQGANIPILSPQNTTEANQVSGHMETK